MNEEYPERILIIYGCGGCPNYTPTKSWPRGYGEAVCSAIGKKAGWELFKNECPLPKLTRRESQELYFIDYPKEV